MTFRNRSYYKDCCIHHAFDKNINANLRKISSHCGLLCIVRAAFVFLCTGRDAKSAKQKDKKQDNFYCCSLLRSFN